MAGPSIPAITFPGHLRVRAWVSRVSSAVPLGGLQTPGPLVPDTEPPYPPPHLSRPRARAYP